MRTYSRADYERSQAEWDEFRAGWTEVRRAAQDWSIFPPSGSRWDQWDAENPTQAAIVARLLDSNKPALLEIVGRSRSWSQVVAGIIQLEDRLNEDIELHERDLAITKAEHPNHVEAVQSIGRIFDRIDKAR
jgi:hypothetical protein